MSGVRRKTKYRKGVEADVLDSFPEPQEGEQIVRVVTSRGGNLLEVESADGVHALCRLPNRYRKIVWIKRGMLLIVTSCTDDFKTAAGEEGKVKFLVNHVIFTDAQTKHLRTRGLLPAVFDAKDEKKSDLEEDEDPLLRANRNRRGPTVQEDSSSDDDDEDEDDAGKGKAQAEGEDEDNDDDEDDDEEEDDE